MELQSLILHSINADPAEVFSFLFLAILVDDLLIRTDSEETPIGALWQFLDRPDTLHCVFMFIASAGDVFRQDNLRFYMHSNEQGHNTPHVHVCIGGDKELSVSILDGTWLAGCRPNKKVWKQIQDIIRDNQETFVQAWNMQTNGLSVDLDYCLGLVH